METPMASVTTTVFKSNQTQAVRLPKPVAFPEGVTEVEILVVGKARVIVPKGGKWDWYFSLPEKADDDFLLDRDQGEAEERESLKWR
jgi:antitoxin VapB